MRKLRPRTRSRRDKLVQRTAFGPPQVTGHNHGLLWVLDEETYQTHGGVIANVNALVTAARSKAPGAQANPGLAHHHYPAVSSNSK